MTVTVIAYAQGWGGPISRHKLPGLRTRTGLGIKNRFGIPDCPERVHWEEELAHEVGAPGAYDYGPERVVADPSHDQLDGRRRYLRNATCKIRRHNWRRHPVHQGQGDPHIEDGTLVAIEQEARQQDTSCRSCTGIVELPSKSK